LLGQITVIIVLSRVMGYVASRVGQPRVIGEMTAGLLLGPSFLGWILPQWSGLLFAPATLGPLNTLSQLGLVVFMFLVGFRLDLDHLRAVRGIAITTSLVSIA